MNSHTLSKKQKIWIGLALLIAAIAYASTLQTISNGSDNPYVKDTGEIQNALPRWGLLHPSGYPLYSLVGSLFVTLLRLGGVQPALSTSLFSMLWGLISVGLLVLLALELDVPGPLATLGAVCMALSTSVWVDASIAEVHTLSLAFTIASLYFAIRFSHTGKRQDLLWLTVIFTQGIAHQRAVAAIGPALLLLTWNQKQCILANWKPIVGLVLLAPLTYLYMIVRRWMGVSWYFGAPETLSGLWAILRDNVFVWPEDLATWRQRLQIVGYLLAQDMFWPVLLIGLLGILGLVRQRRYRLGLGLTLAWGPYILLTMIIWEGYISDAGLAAKLPVLALAGLGLALALKWISLQNQRLGWGAVIAIGLLLLGRSWSTRPFVLSITRDPTAQSIVATAAQVKVSPGDQPTVLMAAWGNMYWALTYAQAYQNQLDGLQLVDHNYDLYGVLQRGERLLVLSRAFHIFPTSWWKSRLKTDKLYISVVEPGIKQLSLTPIDEYIVPTLFSPFPLNDQITIRSIDLTWDSDTQLRLTVLWEATQTITQDYSVAVHLLASDSTALEQPILAQADTTHPVENWYPTTQWHTGEIVRDIYTLQVPDKDAAVAVRVALYYIDSSAQLINSQWLYLPVPPQ